ncbi:uncharacterized protein LOC141666297 [Apium graveolens]|uniref:uncharacterized protein LOC141666297 n=1 Tax=Apium graveolens TaxID=4045 RepID=UPI003D79F903
MESLISEFNYLSDQSLNNKNFDPCTIEHLMHLFELESYKAWASLDHQFSSELQDSEASLVQAEDYLDSAMDRAMREFEMFQEEMEMECKSEFNGLVEVAEKARRVGRSMEKAASFASNKYVEAALNAAGNSMRSAVKAVSNAKKVHPS